MRNERVIDTLRAAIKSQRFEVRGGAVFGPDEHRDSISVNVEVNTHSEWLEGDKGDRRREVVGDVELTLWGQYSYGEDVDRSARVIIRHYFGRAGGDMPNRAHVKADRWNGRKFDNMPQGGRQKVADAVLNFVLQTINSATDQSEDPWHAITREHWSSEHARAIDDELAKARDAQKRADELSSRGPVSMPFAGEGDAR